MMVFIYSYMQSMQIANGAFAAISIRYTLSYTLSARASGMAELAQTNLDDRLKEARDARLSDHQ